MRVKSQELNDSATREVQREAGYDWRVLASGQVQRHIRRDLMNDYSGSRHDATWLAKELLKFSASCQDATVEIEHDMSSDPNYSCDVKLELNGWVDATDLELKAAKRAVRQKRERERLAELHRLEAELNRLKRS